MKNICFGLCCLYPPTLNLPPTLKLRRDKTERQDGATRRSDKTERHAALFFPSYAEPELGVPRLIIFSLSFCFSLTLYLRSIKEPFHAENILIGLSSLLYCLTVSLSHSIYSIYRFTVSLSHCLHSCLTRKFTS